MEVRTQKLEDKNKPLCISLVTRKGGGRQERKWVAAGEGKGRSGG